MSKKPSFAEPVAAPTPQDPPARQATLICAMQSTGRIGKSTSTQVIASWLEFAGIKWSGIDADPEHTNFSEYFMRVDRQPITAPGSLDAIFRTAGKNTPVTLVDFPAGATRTVLDHLETRQTLDALDARGVGLVILLFGSPDPTAESSLREVVTALERQGVTVEQYHPEYAPGQFELSVAPETPTGAADTSVLVRQTIRAVGAARGWRTSYSPKV